jgi:hypothetical protein
MWSCLACARPVKEPLGHSQSTRIDDSPTIGVEVPPEPQTDDGSEAGSSEGSAELPTESPDVVRLQLLLQDSVEQIEQADQINQELITEVLSLYRRLHIELDSVGRSQLIVDLFQDERVVVQLLGFELADRDLSSSTVLEPQVSEYANEMISDPDPIIRSRSARLITRLVPPDAMIILTASLNAETDPIAAEPMLMGIARWPNPDAIDASISWFMRKDSPLEAASSAIWSLDQADYLDTTKYQEQLLDRLRLVDSGDLQQTSMKLIAKFGDASDLRNLVLLLLAPNPNQQQWAANSLVETPRAVEVLVQAAEENEQLFQAASDALIRHRGTPEGLRRLASLPYPDEDTRTQAIQRIGDQLKLEQLSEAVELADLDPTLSAMLLNRLLTGDVQATPRISKGIIRLAEIELHGLRPNRALQAILTVDPTTVDDSDQSKILTIQARSYILLGRMDKAAAIQIDPVFWIDTIEMSSDIELRKKIARYLLEGMPEGLSDNQVEQIRSLSQLEDVEVDIQEPESTDEVDPQTP